MPDGEDNFVACSSVLNPYGARAPTWMNFLFDLSTLSKNNLVG
jgi:hypothetical protein